MKLFYKFPNGKCLAFIARTGSTSVLLAAIQHFSCDLHAIAANDLPSGCVVVTREPLRRFCSLLWRMNARADEALERMHSPVYGNRRDWLQHFRPFSSVAQPDSVLLRFEDDAVWHELDLPRWPERVGAIEEVSVLTAEQEAAVRLAYADDIALWESLS